MFIKIAITNISRWLEYKSFPYNPAQCVALCLHIGMFEEYTWIKINKSKTTAAYLAFEISYTFNDEITT